MFEVIQTISLLSTLSEREGDQNVVKLSTLHAAKGLEWSHVMLVGMTEGSLPFSREREGFEPSITHMEEERRLMYVGITRAKQTLLVSWPKKKKQGRELVRAIPSRFIAEMKLDLATVKENPKDKLLALRAEFAAKAAVLEAMQEKSFAPKDEIIKT